jgi:hypothetical protein
MLQIDSKQWIVESGGLEMFADAHVAQDSISVEQARASMRWNLKEGLEIIYLKQFQHFVDLTREYF